MRRLLPLVVPVVLPALLAAQDAPRAPLISEAVLVQRLNGTMDSRVRIGAFSGVVLLARNGAPVWERAWGLADRARKQPNTIETAFNLGSINKLFTQIAIRQLTNAGKVNPDSTIATYWPDYPNQVIARSVTIRQLLQHRAGLGGDIFGTLPGQPRAAIRHNRDYLALFVNEPPAFAPGTKNRYCNACYVVLGEIVSRVSGEDYYEYVRRHVYEPAGLTRTAAWTVDALPAGTAVGYTTRREGSSIETPVRPNTDDLPGRGSAAGGGYSTAHDLMRFVQALRDGQVPGGPNGVGIAGGSGGMNAVVESNLPGGYDVIVLSNLDPPSAERVSRMVRAWLGGGLDD
jgi:CubicO group peptidase (beta-lactamase class C family)